MNKQWLRISMAVCVIGVVSAGMVLGAGPAPNVATGPNAVTFSSLSADSILTPDLKGILANSSAPISGMFSGNYVAAGVNGIGLRIQTSGTTPAMCALYFKATNGRMWSQWLTLSADASQWTTIALPLDYGTDGNGWGMNDSGGSAAKFNEDLANVDSVGVTFLRRGMAQETYTVADIALLGGKNFASSQALYDFMLTYGIQDMKAGGGSDGLNYWRAFLTGGNPNDPNAAFLLRIDRVQTPTGVALKWNNVPGAGHTYAIWSATDLTSGFTRVTPEGQEIQGGNDSEIVVPVQEEGDQPHYYKVEVIE